MQFKELLYKNYERNHTRTLYGQETLADFRRVFPVWRHHFGKLLPPDKNAAILDIGCGKGSFVWFLQEHGYPRAEGIDISAEQIEYGQALGIQNIRCADMRALLSQQTEMYDCIIARDVMEHFAKQEIFDILFAVRAALRPGGCFIMQSPNGEGIFHAGILYGDFTHETAFTESSLNQIFLNTGFSRVECRPVEPVPKGFVSTVRWLLWQLIVLKTRFYKIVETGSGSGIFTRNIIAKAVRA
jgi:2-polyprenyl-3-methyl-5-hydroxy-6-metoxy-1,4-benzoquinol methylase